MQRLIIVYSPKSSKFLRIRQEVLEPASRLSGYTIGKFEVKEAPVEENASRLSRLLADGDLVISAGGDGTATMTLNAVMQSDARVTLAVMGYGNFNDFARTLSMRSFAEIIAEFEKGGTRKLYPLEVLIDGKHWRYAACYFTVGMFAESTEVFKQPGTRGKLKKGYKGMFFSLRKLSGWYFKNRKREFLPGLAGGRLTDALFINGKTAAKLMKGGDYWRSADKFLVSRQKLSGFFRLVWFMMRSVLFRVPGSLTAEASLKFTEPSEVEIQAEGEYKRVSVREITVKKASRAIDVV